MPTTHPITIIGAGIAGLTLSRCLLARGIPSILYERTPAPPRHGYAITLHPSIYRPLCLALGISIPSFKERVSIPTPATHAEDTGEAAIRIHRGKFEDLLREGLDVRFAHALSTISARTDKQHVVLTLSEMRERLPIERDILAGLVIAADGVHSPVRKALFPEVGLEALPFVAFNGRRKVSISSFEELYASAFRERSGEGGVLEWRVEDVRLRIALIEQSNAEAVVSWTYSRPSRGTGDACFLPLRPVSGAVDIPTVFFAEVGELKEVGLPQPFRDVFDEKKVRGDRVLHWLMRTLLVPLVGLKEVGRKGVVLMGDAVHVEPILGGEGANRAIEDAVSLANLIAEKGTEVWEGWYEERYQSWEDGVERSNQRIGEMHGNIDAAL